MSKKQAKKTAPKAVGKEKTKKEIPEGTIEEPADGSKEVSPDAFEAPLGDDHEYDENMNISGSGDQEESTHWE